MVSELIGNDFFECFESETNDNYSAVLGTNLATLIHVW